MDQAIAYAITKQRLPVLYLDIWTLDDLLNFVEMTLTNGRVPSETRGQSLDTSEAMEKF